MNKDPESWAKVVPEMVCAGSNAQAVNVLRMALEDIAWFAAENRRLEQVLPGYRIGRPNGGFEP